MQEYENEEALQDALERRLRRSLTTKEWADIGPDWSGPYDDSDFAELLEAVQHSLPRPPQRSRTERAREYQRAHVERAAIEARKMVEEFRNDLFGDKAPPFPGHGLEAAQWIESQDQPPESERVGIEITIPAKLGQLASLIWIKDLLNKHLGDIPPDSGDEDLDGVKRFLDQCDAVRQISWRRTMLSYLGLNPHGEIHIRRVFAPDTTTLGRLQSKAGRLAKALQWEEYAAVHHLLTGGIVASSSGVAVATQIRGGREAYGDRNSIRLDISDVDAVTEQELLTAFRRGRADTVASVTGPTRRRGAMSPRSERLAGLVEDTPNMSWADRHREHSRRNPGDRYRTVHAMKQAYYRTTPR